MSDLTLSLHQVVSAVVQHRCMNGHWSYSIRVTFENGDKAALTLNTDSSDPIPVEQIADELVHVELGKSRIEYSDKPFAEVAR